MNTHLNTERRERASESSTAHRRSTMRGGNRPRIVAILAALGGRYGWRWWMPLLVWGVFATVARLQANADPTMFPFQTGAYESLTLASLLAVLALWFWGSRLAVTLGHRRGHVFGLASVATVVMLVGAPLLAEIASFVEHTQVGRGALRVMATSVPKSYDGVGEPVPPFSLLDLVSWTLTDLVYILPVLMSLVVTLCWWMRWGWRGVLPGLLLVPVALLSKLALWSLFVSFARGPRQSLLAEGLALGASAMVLLALVWAAFRRTPV